MNRVVSAEDNFLKFEPRNLIVDLDKAAVLGPKEKTNISGMFIPIKYIVPGGTTSFKLQTPEVSGFLTDCDQKDRSGQRFKISLLLDSTNKDPTLSKEYELQRITVEILEQFKEACISQLTPKQEDFEKKLNSKKKINADSWQYMINNFDVVRSHTKSDGNYTCSNYYINPKIVTNQKFTTSFVYNQTEISCETAIEQFLDKKVYCIALFSIDSLFYQSSSNKLFAQAKLENLHITRPSISTREQIVIPNRLKQIEQPAEELEEETFST